MGFTRLAAAETPEATARAKRAAVITNFEMLQDRSGGPEAGPRRVRIEGTVYYYDALWQSLWLKCGETIGYLAVGTKDWGLREGQRVLVEGQVAQPGGWRIQEAQVTVLAAGERLPAESINGRVGEVLRHTQRMVTMDALVDYQSLRDLGHLEVGLVADGERVAGQLLVGKNGAVPQLVGKLVRARGMYYARRDGDIGPPRLELWIGNHDDLQVTGSLERDPRFELPVSAVERLGDAAAGDVVRIDGVLAPRVEGQPLRLRCGNATVVLRTVQETALKPGDRVEAIGWPARRDGEWGLDRALFRDARQLFLSFAEVWGMPETERNRWQRLQAPFDVYYYDPYWKTLWGGSEGSYDYISLGERVMPIKSGQRILIEGLVSLREGLRVEEAKTTVLAENLAFEALDTHGQVADTQRWDKRFVVIEGYVDRLLVTDAHHLEVDLLAGGRNVVVRLLLADGQTPPQWEGALLRIKGVYVATADPTGGAPMIELWCPGMEKVQVVGALAQDTRFERPMNPIDSLPGLKAGDFVRVAGVVRAQQPGKSVTLRDGTGQIVLRTAQTRSVAIGERVEAVGNYVPGGMEGSYVEGIFRHDQSVPPPPPAGLPKLRLADQLRELLPEEAGRSYPVHLAGVVTWFRANADFFFVRDVSGGVCVYLPPGEKVQALTMGAKVEVTGVSASGRYTPVVLASTVQATSTIELPEPRPVTLEQALTGVEEAQWVSMSGYLRGVEPEGPWVKLQLTTAAGEFAAMLAPNPRWEKIVGSVVRVRGVCSALANHKRQLTGIQVWVPSSRFVEVEDPAPVDPFSVGERSIASLRQYSSLDLLNRRVRIAGVVVHRIAGRLLHLQDGNESLLVLSRAETPVMPGDRIEAVGIPGRQNNRLVLRESVYRKVGGASEPAPVPVAAVDDFNPELDGRLVRTQGVILQAGAREPETELLVQQGRAVFAAILEPSEKELPARWAPNSEVSLTGVYKLEFDEYHRPHDVRLLLRSPADVAVLKQAPWWTAQRALLAAGLLLVGLVLGFGWVLALRRRVQQQTVLIRERVETEKAARLEAALARASKLESLGVLAGGIAHDFNNLLTVVIGNLSLARLDDQLAADTRQCVSESERAAMRARDLTQQLLTFAKGGEPIRASTALPDVVREAAQFALHGSKVACEFDIAADLWPADVDRGQVGQVVNNLIINATQAMPAGGQIRIVMRNEELAEPRQSLVAGRYVKTTFSDSGTGISAENLPRIFEPYFTTKRQGSGLGLATVYSIVKRHHGHIEVTSEMGKGTTFHVWLPAAASAPLEVAEAPRAAAARTGRVLLMDDEPAIRMVGATVLKRRGFDVTAVADGATAVREFEAAIAAHQPFDVVVLDLTVPGGMGGAEAMTRLKAIDPRVRAIVASGYSSDPVMANYQNYGFGARVPKPYQAVDLTDAIDAVLRGS